MRDEKKERKRKEEREKEEGEKEEREKERKRKERKRKERKRKDRKRKERKRKERKRKERKRKERKKNKRKAKERKKEDWHDTSRKKKTTFDPKGTTERHMSERHFKFLSFSLSFFFFLLSSFLLSFSVSFFLTFFSLSHFLSLSHSGTSYCCCLLQGMSLAFESLSEGKKKESRLRKKEGFVCRSKKQQSTYIFHVLPNSKRISPHFPYRKVGPNRRRLEAGKGKRKTRREKETKERKKEREREKDGKKGRKNGK